MEVITHERLKETVYRETMDNGLQVYVLPKPGFQKTYATFSTKYGSIDNGLRFLAEAAADSAFAVSP